MKQFVLLFRTGPRPLSEADQKRRADEVAAWARRQNGEGHRLDPRQLEPIIERIGPNGEVLPATAETDEGPLANILFLEAPGFGEAVRIARSHPGLRYGASVEVRAWKPPAAPPGTTPGP